jgi:hypothetical protein
MFSFKYDRYAVRRKAAESQPLTANYRDPRQLYSEPAARAGSGVSFAKTILPWQTTSPRNPLPTPLGNAIPKATPLAARHNPVDGKPADVP